ncbi:MAG: hypothetical protein QM500_16020, partial [Methylococcales bacterium]
LTRKTICFSKSEKMHDIVIGLLINKVEFGVDIRPTTDHLYHVLVTSMLKLCRALLPTLFGRIPHQ